MTPVEIYVLASFHVGSTSLEMEGNIPQVIRNLKSFGLIEDNNMLTKKGCAYMAKLESIPLPVQTWGFVE